MHPYGNRTILNIKGNKNVIFQKSYKNVTYLNICLYGFFCECHLKQKMPFIHGTNVKQVF